jgi:hypothetical protein
LIAPIRDKVAIARRAGPVFQSGEERWRKVIEDAGIKIE